MHRDVKRYYAVLELGTTCSDEDIRVAFRRLAKALHPDAVTGNAASFIALKRAYDILSDPVRRARYDRASRPRVRARSTLEMPPPSRSRRPGGMSAIRYVAAFVLVGGLSLGAVEAMISYAGDESSAGHSHPVSLLSTETAKGESFKTETLMAERPASTPTPTLHPGAWDPSAPEPPPPSFVGSPGAASPR